MISGIVGSHNHASTIADCLGSLAPHVSELILIDLGSSDQTVELARPLATQVLHLPPANKLDAVCRAALSAAKYDWLWFIGGDEIVPALTGHLVNETVNTRGNEFAMLTVLLKKHFCGKWIQHSGWWPGNEVSRILKRGSIQFGEEGGSGIRFDGPELRIAPREDLAIERFSFPSIEHYLVELNRLTTMEAAERHASGAASDWQRGIREMVRDLWAYYEQNQGVLDGYHGWVLAWLSGQFRWMAEAKLLDIPERRESVGTTEVPRNLDEVVEVIQQELGKCRSQKPKPPLAVHLRSPLVDASGSASEGRALLKALALSERSVSAEEFRSHDATLALTPTEAALVRSMQRHRTHGPRISITNGMNAEPDAAARVNVLRTTRIGEPISPELLSRLDAFEEIWVATDHDQQVLRRAGAAPERIRLLRQAVDTSIFTPGGRKLELPATLADRFVFLAVLDWDAREGWDILLKGYCEEFGSTDGAGLLLKISRWTGQRPEEVVSQAEQVMGEVRESLASRADIVLFEDLLAPADMAALFRSAQAYVLPTRAQGRVGASLEAMACGLPVIATTGNGNEEFLNDAIGFPVQTILPAGLGAKRPIRTSQQQREPSIHSLRAAMRTIFENRALATEKVAQAIARVQEKHSLPVFLQTLESRLVDAEARFAAATVPPPQVHQLRVELEGEFFAGHSFSNINEQLAQIWKDDDRIALSLRRRWLHPVHDERVPTAHQLHPYMGRELRGGPEVTIRHSFPPNWQPLPQGKWVHIQPWEFGYLPKDWIAPLREQVDEIWAPSEYVRDVFVASGIPDEKIHVVPWGIDPDVYRPDVPQRNLPTDRGFRFLFVGGTLARKGFDLALEAYLQEFSRDEDVCFVIKDAGTRTFYRYGNCREQIARAMADPRAPQILYFDSEMTDGQRASLYTSCNCLVAPYRGEGFGLPILEAMACGLVPIIPRGGPTDDFTSEETAYFVSSRFVPCDHDWELCGQATEIKIELADLRRALREAFEARPETQRRGEAASLHARMHFTWKQSVEKMNERLQILTRGASPALAPSNRLDHADFRKLDLTVCLLTQDSEAILASCLSRIAPFVQKLIVADLGSRDRSAAIAREYGAELAEHPETDPSTARARIAASASTGWVLHLDPSRLVSEEEIQQIAAAMEGAAESDTEVRLKPSGGQSAHEAIVLRRNRSTGARSVVAASSGLTAPDSSMENRPAA